MKNLFKALAAFQQEVKPIKKKTQGYNYKYADLETILETINPLMKKHGLGFTQMMEGASLRTTIFHIESGENISSLCDIPQDVKLKGMNDFQVLGSAITYIRRYTLSTALGLITDEDTDAAGEQEPKEKKTITTKSEAYRRAVAKKVPLEVVKESCNMSAETEMQYKQAIK